ncbi:MAG: MBL fold metallo-hydrolase [Muribaculaceae bacterium]|nr:MBL fold metallo-hydrolase [Muribaculaceae bacterium]
MLKVASLQNNPFSERTYIVYNPATNDAVIVDPGMLTSDERLKCDNFLSSNHLTLRSIVNTHLHLDHCFGANYVRDKYGVKLYAHPDDAFLGSSIAQQARSFGIDGGGSVNIDVKLSAGDRIDIGDDYLQVIHTPGHTPGGICLYSPSSHFVLSGDTLFNGSVGRTDLPGGNFNTLKESIFNRLFTLPDETLVLPGHGPHTTIAAEKASNPFLR